MLDADVVVVGAGLTGLRAAWELSQAGASVLVVEKCAYVGGRMQTSVLDGFTLDHGFQVLLSAYPELRALGDIETLRPQPFWSGARVRWRGKFFDLVDPRAQPLRAATLLSLPFASARDLMQLARLVLLYRAQEVRSDGHSTDHLLSKLRFSPSFQDAFLRPFLRGVSLDPALSLDAALTRFYLKMFSRGAALLPALGARGLPELLADRVGRSHILLGVAATALTARHVVLANGETLHARAVICALDAVSAAQLGCPEQTIPSHASRVFYFSASEPPFPEPLLVLNGEGGGPINHLAVLSNVQPAFAPPGVALISASLVGAVVHVPEHELLPQIRAQLSAWYGDAVTRWEPIRSFTIPAAVPARPRMSAGWILHNGVFYAGDYLSYGSQNGALRAGRQAAAAVLEQIPHTAATAGSV